MTFDADSRINEWKKCLLDTTKRNRLIKFSVGRGGGIEFLHPSTDAFWQLMVVNGQPHRFPWKRDILGLPAEVIDESTSEQAVDLKSSTFSDTTTSLSQPDQESKANFSSLTQRPRGTRTLRELTSSCLASDTLRTGDLLTDLSDRKLAASLQRLARTASESETEHGVSTLYAAFGFLRWFDSSDSQEEIQSPLVLVPVKLSRDSIDAAWVLRAEEDDPAVNHCLAELLKSEFRLSLPDWENEENETDGPGRLVSYLAEVAKRVKTMARWEVVAKAAIGVFNFQKLAMWQDLTTNAELIKNHKLCRAIAGDFSVELRPPPGLVAAVNLDEEIPPDTCTHILDADSSQHEAIDAIKRGADIVIDGPPGTGKSQTIANAIAELLASGKSVLFVSEKTAALEVVKRRLDACGLGDFCLELHSHKANKREVTAELGRCIELGPESYRPLTDELRQLTNCRHRLNSYADELHRPRSPLNMSVFQVQGELAHLADLPIQSRWHDQDILARDSEFLRRAMETLTGLARCRTVIESSVTHPWRGCKITNITQSLIDDASYNLNQLTESTANLAAGQTLVDLELEGPSDTIPRWLVALEFARSLLAVSIIPSKWFEANPLVSAANAISLHETTSKARILLRRLESFSPEAINDLTPEKLSELASNLSGHEELLIAQGSLTARGRVEKLRKIAFELSAVAKTLDRVAVSFDRVLAALQIPGKTVPLCQIRKYAHVGLTLSQSVAVPSSWWNAKRREEILIVAERFSQEEASANSLRGKLSKIFSSEAFDQEAWPIITEAQFHGNSFLRRLFPKWSALRRKISGWHTGQLPDLANLIGGLDSLSTYHRQMRNIRVAEAEYATEIVATKTGKADWIATCDAIKAVEKYEKWKLPSELKSAMAPNGQLDREFLEEVSNELAKDYKVFQSALNDLLVHGALDDQTDFEGFFATELAAKIRLLATKAESESVTLGRLTHLLRDGHDLSPGSWNARLDDLVELMRLRALTPSHAAAIGHDHEALATEATDWSLLAKAAESLRHFLSINKGQLSLATIAALTQTAARERVQKAVMESESALRQGIKESWKYLVEVLFPKDSVISDGVILSQISISDLARWTRSRLSDLTRIDEWVNFERIRREAAALQIETVLIETCDGKLPLDLAPSAFRRRFFSLWLDAVFSTVPVLSEFSAEDHDSQVNKFSRLDRMAIQAAPARLRSQLLAYSHRPHAGGTAPNSSEIGILLREANKKKKHMALRRLFAAIPTLLPRLKPCMMMSPLAVSTYLNSPKLIFDAVIFDEASQVRPHDSICAVYRGRQLVVAGDPRQLPPTDFFARSIADDTDEHEAEEGTAGFESLLDVCLSLGLTRKRLRWHYRSRREGLIAFSNKFFYDGGLVTFPSAEEGIEPAVRLERVANGRFEEGVNVPEARLVADLTIAHFRSKAKLSLGVIAFSQRQQNQILDELEIRRRANPELEEFFKEDLTERFFVKNLENVQGDERDVIFLSVGYGPNDAGKVAMRFGPLNRDGGERRLNVAITRARSAMTVVASMGATDIDLSRTQAEGAKLLRAFLDYSARGPRALSEAVTSADEGWFDSPFEQDVYEQLSRRGLTLHKQVGCGGFKIDMAVVDPSAKGRYLLGIECDGATYHSSATARDRDRLRQTVLEGLGWRFCRIWSTDWLRNRERQVLRVLTLLDSPKKFMAEENTKNDMSPLLHAVPTVLVRSTANTPPFFFANIDAVPQSLIRSTVLNLLTEFGSTNPDDLCVTICRRLGFKRLGAKIKSRLEEVLDAMIAMRQLARQSDGRLAIIISSSEFDGKL